MPDNITTPTPNGTVLAFKDVGSVLFALNMLVDQAGTDAMGTVAGTPAAGTLLGRLKAIADGVATLAGHVDGLEGLSTALNGFVDGLEGLLGTTNTTLTTLGTYVDGLETLQGTANSTLTAISGFVDGLETLLAAATPAGENYIGKQGGDVLPSSVVPATASFATPYSAGDAIGSKLTFSNMTRLASGSGVIGAGLLNAKTAQATQMDLVLFNADPTASTITDNAAFVVGAADYDKVFGVVKFTDWTALGGPSVGQAQAQSIPFKLPLGQTIYGALVARGAVTLTSATDLKVGLNVIPG